MNAEAGSNRKSINNGLLRDFAWYFASSLLPLLVGLLKTPVFTRHFSVDAFGSLGIVQITFSYLGMLLFSWISSCLWRFYQKYKSDGRSDRLNGSLMLFSGVSFIILSAFSGAWYVLAENQTTRELILVSYFHLVFSQLVMAYLVIVRLESRASLYTALQSFRAVLSFGLSLYLVFYLNMNIVALITGLAVVDGLAVLLLSLWNPVRVTASASGFRSKELKELFSYGMAGLVMNISLLSLNLSDRYVILFSEGLASVGVYDQVYKISLLSVSALVTVFFNTINPQLFKELEHDFKASLNTTSRYLRMFLAVGLPLVVYLSLFSKEISNILLGPDFREGYPIMPLIFFAAFLQGLSNFFELRMKFSDQMRLLSVVFLTGSILNLVLNLALVPAYGYFWAAFSTVLTILLIIVFFNFRDRSLISSLRMHKGEFAQFTGLLALQTLIFFVVEKFEPSMPFMIFLGLIFVLSYGWLLRKTGVLTL